jgi:hypothetical protein
VIAFRVRGHLAARLVEVIWDDLGGASGDAEALRAVEELVRGGWAVGEVEPPGHWPHFDPSIALRADPGRAMCTILAIMDTRPTPEVQALAGDVPEPPWEQPPSGAEG